MSHWKKIALAATLLAAPATAWAGYHLASSGGCGCGETCKCGKDCQCGKECKCGSDCKCGNGGCPHHT